LDDEQLAKIADANYWESFSMLARSCGGAVLESDDVLGIRTGLPVPMLNHGLITGKPNDIEGSLRALIAFFEEVGVPHILRVREGVAPDAEKVMEAMGFPYSDTTPGMVMFPIGDPPPLPDGLRIESVQDVKGLGQFQEAMAEGFSMPLDLAKGLITPAVLGVDGFESYLGFLDGKAVATSGLYYGDGTAGVYNVGTLPDYRRRGLGAAMTWHAVSRGADHGCTVSILQASVMGKPVYERMGFRTVAPYRTFVRSPKEGREDRALG
jgi:ribosomal protein S18 acetylase RimI-like enzyme